ncbi:MAG TPA: carboxypeptidase regulatory-like domain-containing protein [Terriglobia bacterium]|nr:carboxypeptidase regulatory-like domain-containing protein [Terriglobia bacterium]
MWRTRSKAVVLSLALVSLMVTARASFGQSITGDILGTVHDPSGAVVTGAKVTLTAVDTGIKFEATSDAGGDYLFAELKPGHYGVEASKEGFETAAVSDIELLVGQRPRVDVTLRVGATTQTVEVSAGGVVQLETQTSSMNQITQETAVENLPIVNRNFIDLVALSAGVAPIGQGNSPASYWTGAGQGNVTTSVAGGRESDESFIVDGIESRNARFGSANLRPSFDAIQEINVQTSNFSAEYGRSAAVINTTLKSGSNNIHGDAYDYVENNILNANNFFSNLTGLPKGIVRYNDFGATIGGPVVLPYYNGRDKTFFFFSYEGLRNPTVTNLTALDPSPAQLAGNLADNSGGTGFFPTSSAYCQAAATAHSPHCVDVINPATGQPFPGNLIPTSMLNSTTQKWLPYWPAPNVANPSIPSAGAFPVYNYAISARGYVNSDQYNARVDEALTSRDQLWGAFTHDNRPTFAPGALPLSGSSWPLSDTLFTLTETHTFSPTIVNEARLGYNRGRTYLVGQGALTQNYAQSAFSFTNTSPNPFDFGVPGAGVSDFSDPGSPSESIGALDQDYQVVDNLSIVRGNHNLKMGVNYIHELFNQITDFGGVPGVSFNGLFTSNSLGDFLLGDPLSATASVGDSSQDLISNYYAGFLQDNWRVRPNFTLNLGVRYEYGQTPWDRSSKTGWFDPTTQLVEYSRSGAVRNGIVDPDWHNLAPRVGFSYSPSFLHNTVMRGAFGIFYATDNWNELQFEVVLPAFYTTQTLNSDPTKPTLSMSSLFPTGSFGSGTTVPFSLDKRSRTPYVQQWDYDIQHTFSHNMFLDVGYIGNVGQRLPQRRNEDAPTFDPTGTIPIADRVPYPNYSWILLDYNGGWSSYNGLAVRFTKRFGGGMFLNAAYTWSHTLDLGNTDDFSASQCCFKTIDKGNGDYDVRNRFVLSYVYDLPFGRGRRYLSGVSGALNKVVTGWQVSGVTTFSSGQYESVTLPADWQVQGAFSTSYADKVGPAYPANKSYTHWLNSNSFVYPGCPVGDLTPITSGSKVNCPNPIHLQGNSGRNSIEEPGINNWDIAAFKRTPITERLNTELRAEFYNAWNHTQFAAPSTSLAPGTFGVITSTLPTGGPRVIQLAFKLLF